VFTREPSSQTIATGDTVVLRAAATGTAPKYQWLFNGAPLGGATVGFATVTGSTSATLVISGASAANAGTYTCIATNSGVALASSAATIAVVPTQDPGRLVNVSARADVGLDADALIVGYVVGGPQATGTENVLIRASGPALAQFGVPDFMPDPDLTLTPLNLLGVSPILVPAWAGDPTVAATAESVGAFAWNNPESLDAAAVAVTVPGSHTALVQGTSGNTGVALVEIYDATPVSTYTPATPHLTNVSARINTGTGDDLAVTGFVIGGSTSKTVLIRASGPALGPFGLTGTLPDPWLQLFASNAGNAPIAANSGWAGDPAVSAAAAAVGAFSWSDATSLDSALLITLPPGAYTAQVTGQSGDTGLALIEVYEVP